MNININIVTTRSTAAMVMMGKKIMMSLYVTPEQRKALQAASKTTGRPMQEIVREGLDFALAKYKPKSKGGAKS